MLIFHTYSDSYVTSIKANNGTYLRAQGFQQVTPFLFHHGSCLGETQCRLRQRASTGTRVLSAILLTVLTQLVPYTPQSTLLSPFQNSNSGFPELLTDFDLFRPRDYVALDAADYIPLEVLGGKRKCDALCEQSLDGATEV